MQPSEQIKSKLDIVDVIKEHVSLKPAGTNFRGLCPFHREKSPSFMVSPEKQIFHCFGCGAGGDIFEFVMKTDGLSFPEALRLLAPKAGVELKDYNPAESSLRNKLLDILDMSAKYYHKVLMESKQGEKAMEYLTKRGLDEETIEYWRIGYSPDSWEDVVTALKGKGFTDNEILKSGMGIQKEGTNRIYNRFRGRIMFPICDVNANVVAFTARVSPEKEATEKGGKYINSPQTQIYDKSRILFAMDKAKTAIRNEDMAIVVEGQMDAITAHQFGFKNVIASSGTALTLDQIKIIERYTHNIAFALDADAAGQNAIERGDEIIKDSRYASVQEEDRWGRVRTYIDPLLSTDLNIKVIGFTGAKDPDELIRSDKDAWASAVAGAKPIMEHHFQRVLDKLDLRQVDHKRQAVKLLLPKISKLGSKVEQDLWIKRLAERIDIGEGVIRETLAANFKSAKVAEPSNPVMRLPESRPQSREEKINELVLALILRFTSLIDYAINNVSLDYLFGDNNRALYKGIVLYYNNSTYQSGQDNGRFYPLDYANFKKWLETEHQAAILGFYDHISLLADKEYQSLTEDEAKKELAKLINELRKQYFISKKKEAEREIISAEERGDKDAVAGFMEDLKILNLELNEIS